VENEVGVVQLLIKVKSSDEHNDCSGHDAQTTVRKTKFTVLFFEQTRETTIDVLMRQLLRGPLTVVMKLTLLQTHTHTSIDLG